VTIGRNVPRVGARWPQSPQFPIFGKENIFTERAGLIERNSCAVKRSGVLPVVSHRQHRARIPVARLEIITCFVSEEAYGYLIAAASRTVIAVSLGV
jgi:hypothetical protein